MKKTKIKMLTAAAGPDCNLKAGGVYIVGHHLDQKFADDLLKGGFCVEYEEVAVEPEEGETTVEKKERKATKTEAPKTAAPKTAAPNKAAPKKAAKKGKKKGSKK